MNLKVWIWTSRVNIDKRQQPPAFEGEDDEKRRTKVIKFQSILDFKFEQEGSVFLEPKNCCSKITLQKISVDTMATEATWL